MRSDILSAYPIRNLALTVFTIYALLVVSGTALTSGDGVGGNQFMASSRLVFVEDITATWCGYCPAASEGLKDLSYDRDDFRFITLIDDRVEDASERI